MRVLQYYNWGYFEPITCGADVIAANQLEYFRRRGWEVDVLLQVKADRAHQAASFHQRYPWVRSVRLAASDTEEFSFRGQLFVHEGIARSDVFQSLARERHDLFLTNYAFTAPLALAIPSGCKKVLEALDIVTDSFALYERTKNGRKALRPQAVDSFYWRLEVDLYRIFDRVLFINEQECRMVEPLCPGKTAAVPPMVPSDFMRTSDPGSDLAHPGLSDQEFDLIFVGSNAIANTNAINFFYRRIFVPYLREHGVRIAVVGNVCDKLDFHDWNVRRLGNVKGNLQAFYERSKVVIIPILEGTGLSIKTIECLASGRAVASSPIGARGLRPDADAFLQLDMLNDPEDTARAILELLGSEPSRLRMERKAVEYYRENFGEVRYFFAMDNVMASLGLLSPSGGSGTGGGARDDSGIAVPLRAARMSLHQTPAQG